MKLECSGYTRQSTECNDHERGVCKQSVIESSKPANISVRCPRMPFKGDVPYYVTHTKEISEVSI